MLLLIFEGKKTMKTQSVIENKMSLKNVEKEIAVKILSDDSYRHKMTCTAKVLLSTRQIQFFV